MKKTKYYDTRVACIFRKEREDVIRVRQLLIEHFDVKRILESIRKYCRSNKVIEETSLIQTISDRIFDVKRI